MSVEVQISEKLQAAFSPEVLQVINERAKHAGHAGHHGSNESHFRVVIQADSFNDMNRLARHRAVLREEAEDLRREIETLFLRAGFTPPDPEEALARFRDRPRLALDMFEVLVQEGVLVRLSEKLYFHRRTLEKARRLVVDYLQKHGEMGVGDFRRLTGGASRKYLIPLLEYLDREKVTIRVGDRRILRKGVRT